MSKTPDTDANIKFATAANGKDYEVVDPDFARQLELRLVETTRQRNTLRDLIHSIAVQLEDNVDQPDGQALLREINDVLRELEP